MSYFMRKIRDLSLSSETPTIWPTHVQLFNQSIIEFYVKTPQVIASSIQKLFAASQPLTVLHSLFVVYLLMWWIGSHLILIISQGLSNKQSLFLGGAPSSIPDFFCPYVRLFVMSTFQAKYDLNLKGKVIGLNG